VKNLSESKWILRRFAPLNDKTNYVGSLKDRSDKVPDTGSVIGSLWKNQPFFIPAQRAIMIWPGIPTVKISQRFIESSVRYTLVRVDHMRMEI